MVTAGEIADFLRGEFPQTKCVVEAVGDGTSTVSHEITAGELRPGGTVFWADLDVSGGRRPLRRNFWEAGHYPACCYDQLHYQLPPQARRRSRHPRELQSAESGPLTGSG